MMDEGKSATPSEILLPELMDSRVPKTEREHFAAREINRLRARIAELERERDKLQDALAITRNACASRKAQRDEYRHMAECAAITAVCGYFSRMRGPDAWQYREVGRNRWKDCLPLDVNRILAFNRNGSIGQHGFHGYEVRGLYAGSAPVPAVVSQNDADLIHNESCVQPPVRNAEDK